MQSGGIIAEGYGSVNLQTVSGIRSDTKALYAPCGIP